MHASVVGHWKTLSSPIKELMEGVVLAVVEALLRVWQEHAERWSKSDLSERE